MARFHNDMDALEMRARRRTACDRVDRRDHRAGRTPARIGQRVSHARNRVLRRVDVPALRGAVALLRRADAATGARARRESRRSAPPPAARLRALAAVARRRARVARAVRRRASRLAHRVLGHGDARARSDDRPARRRHRPDLPPPRVRDRAEREPHGEAVRDALAALGDGQLRRREDVEVARQPRLRRRAVEERRSPRHPARTHAASLPPRFRVVPHRSRRGHRVVASVARRGRAHIGSRPAPFAQRVRNAIDDDLDSPRALDALDDLASAILSGATIRVHAW